MALNPVIQFTTLFARLAVERAVQLTKGAGPMVGHVPRAACFACSTVFVWRSFYGMRITSGRPV